MRSMTSRSTPPSSNRRTARRFIRRRRTPSIGPPRGESFLAAGAQSATAAKIDRRRVGHRRVYREHHRADRQVRRRHGPLGIARPSECSSSARATMTTRSRRWSMPGSGHVPDACSRSSATSPTPGTRPGDLAQAWRNLPALRDPELFAAWFADRGQTARSLAPPPRPTARPQRSRVAGLPDEGELWPPEARP